MANPYASSGCPPQDAAQEGNTSVTLTIVSPPPSEMEFPYAAGYRCKVAVRNTGRYPVRIPFVLAAGEHSLATIKVVERVMVDHSEDGLFILPKSLEPGEEKIYTLNIIPERIGEETLTFRAGGQNIPDQPPGKTIRYRIVYSANAAQGKWGFVEIAGLLAFIAIVLAAVIILLKGKVKKTGHEQVEEEPKTMVRLKPARPAEPRPPIHPRGKAVRQKKEDDKKGKTREQKLPKTLILSSSVREIESNEKDKAELTVKVLDQDSQPLMGQVVEFVAIDRGTITPIDRFTGEDGIVKALFLPEPGSRETSQVGALCPDYPDVSHRIFIKVVPPF